jgi:hypothetical protein
MAGADAGTKAPAASERLLEGCEAIPRKTGIAYITEDREPPVYFVK